MASCIYCRMASLYKVFLLVVLLCLLHKATADCSSEGKSCDECYQTLASCLVNTNDNLYQLQRAFFPPPKKTPSVFVAVTYSYNHPNISDQIWFWSAGIFYFYQPLRVFQFTSLFFGNPNWRRNNVTLTLPAHCANAPDEFMELLTQMVSTRVYIHYLKIWNMYLKVLRLAFTACAQTCLVLSCFLIA